MSKQVKKLVIPVSYETSPSEAIPLMAFLFDRKGKLLEKVAVEKQQANFQTAVSDPRSIRVLIAPAFDKRFTEAGTIERLMELRAFEPVIDLDERGNVKILPVPDYLSRLWKLRFCRVRGQVSKDFVLHGIKQERGICHARVHICEVNKLFLLLPKIPDYVIERIPDLVLEPEIPIPLPDPGPLFPPEMFLKNVIAPPSLRTLPAGRLSRVAIPVRPLSAPPVQPRVTAPESPRLSVKELKEQIKVREISVTRQLLLDNFDLFHPYFCYFPWIWPWFYRCDEIKTVYTDANGRFDTSIIYLTGGDHPDLYFWVEYLIDGVWTTVYKPSVPCHTYWNFDCGSEVKIKITDERVRWECSDPIDGDIVWVKTIGQGASVSRIRQADDTVTIQGNPFNQIGLTDASVTLGNNAPGDFRSPFGSQLNFVVQFGSGIPVNDVAYFRWSWRKLRNGALSPDTGSANYFSNELHKSYTFEFIDSNGDKQFDSNSFRLGPNLVGGKQLYYITPTSPAMAPVNAPEASPLWNQNTVALNFDSRSLDGDGLYEFQMELFDHSGNQVEVAKAGQFFRVPHASTFSPSVIPPDDYLEEDGSGNVTAFRMKVRIDNNNCGAIIYSPSVDGVTAPATDCCGFNKYQSAASPIKLAFTASHPFNLATFSFNVKRGTCTDVLANVNTSGMVIGSTGNYSRNSASRFENTETVGSIMGSCSKAAFAENLYVASLAINGSRRLYEYDEADTAAFALEPL